MSLLKVRRYLRLRVLQVTERYSPAIGGVETHVFNLTRELYRLGIQLTVLTTNLLTTKPLRRFDLSKGSAAAREGVVRVLRHRAYEVLPLRQGLGLVSLGMLKDIHGVDLVHAHGYGHFPTFLAPFCKLRKIPAVITTHSDIGGLSLRKKFFDAVVPKITLRYASRIIALSNHEKASLITRGVPSEAITIIPNGVDIDEFARKNRYRVSSRDSKVILYVGRIDFQQKGLDILVRALARLVHERNLDIKLRLIGPDWGDLSRLEEMARKLAVETRVEYLGPLPRRELVRKMHEANVFVLPSRFEPFGISLLEAMASEIPVVASRVGGVPEIVQEGVTGLLFEPENDESLSDRVEQVLTNESYGSELARNAFSSLHKYSWRTIAKRTLKVYRETLVAAH